MFNVVRIVLGVLRMLLSTLQRRFGVSSSLGYLLRGRIDFPPLAALPLVLRRTTAVRASATSILYLASRVLERGQPGIQERLGVLGTAEFLDREFPVRGHALPWQSLVWFDLNLPNRHVRPGEKRNP